MTSPRNAKRPLIAYTVKHITLCFATFAMSSVNMELNNEYDLFYQSWLRMPRDLIKGNCVNSEAVRVSTSPVSSQTTTQ